MHAAEPNLRVIDIGANVGDSVATIWQHCQVPVLCIEGDSAYFDYLERNTRHLNGVSRVRAFLGERRTTISGGVDAKSGSARIKPHASGAPIFIITLPEVIAQFPAFAHSRLIKVDTDGMDAAILMGSMPYLESEKPVVFFEYDPDLAAQAGDDPRRALDMLRDIGFEMAIFYDNTGEYLASVDLQDGDLLADLHSFFVGRGGTRYADICVFHRQDSDLWSVVRQGELAHAGLRRVPTTYVG
jgi:FkbM family methyltransferase